MSNKKLQTQLLGASAMVMEMAVITLLGAFAGNWLDGQLHTSPLMLMLLLCGGLTFGMYRLLQRLHQLQSTDDHPTPSDDHS